MRKGRAAKGEVRVVEELRNRRRRKEEEGEAVTQFIDGRRNRTEKRKG